METKTKTGDHTKRQLVQLVHRLIWLDDLKPVQELKLIGRHVDINVKSSAI